MQADPGGGRVGTLPWPGEGGGGQTAANTAAAEPGAARAKQVGNYVNTSGRLGAMRNGKYRKPVSIASQFLPPGYRVEAYSGQREGKNGGPHSGYAAAID